MLLCIFLCIFFHGIILCHILDVCLISKQRSVPAAQVGWGLAVHPPCSGSKQSGKLCGKYLENVNACVCEEVFTCSHPRWQHDSKNVSQNPSWALGLLWHTQKEICLRCLHKSCLKASIFNKEIHKSKRLNKKRGVVWAKTFPNKVETKLVVKLHCACWLHTEPALQAWPAKSWGDGLLHSTIGTRFCHNNGNKPPVNVPALCNQQAEP